MDASTIAAVAALAFALGVVFALGLGLGLAAAVRLARRVERAERQYRAQPRGRRQDRPPFPPYPVTSGRGGRTPMVRPRTPTSWGASDYVYAGA